MKEDSCVKKYFGKYRGTVVNNIDPEQRGRIQAIVPDVSGIVLSSWAEPSLPVGGPQTGMFTVPQFGAGVWIEFEQGNPDFPVWTGCYWGNTAEVPALAKTIPPGVPGVALQTTAQNGIVVSDVPGPSGGIMLKSTAGATIIVNDTGIYIQNGKGASLMMVGKQVIINEGALVIT